MRGKHLVKLVAAAIGVGFSCVPVHFAFSESAVAPSGYCKGTKLDHEGTCDGFVAGYLAILQMIDEDPALDLSNIVWMMTDYAGVPDQRLDSVVKALVNYRTAVASHDSYDFTAPYVNCKLALGFELPADRKERAKCVITGSMYNRTSWWETNTVDEH